MPPAHLYPFMETDMSTFQMDDHPHRRYNPLTQEWILVSPHRAKRPWQGQTEEPAVEQRPSYDPKCYLCPGNERAGGSRNPQYTDTYVFGNDFAALLADTPSGDMNEGNLLVAESDRGICRVICFSPRHDMTLPLMEPPAIRGVIDLWADQYSDIGSNAFINWVQIFENKGAMMGCSNPHPHGQIWSNERLPNEPAKELRAQSSYWQDNHRCLLCDCLALEVRLQERLVCENKHFVALVPFWATWPFETMVLSRRHLEAIPELDSPERDALADILKRLTARYDNLFHTSFPYSMGWHQSPTDGELHPEWHLHAHFYPPLLRSATVKKFMVGYEMLATAQRDITAETSAARLRELPETHYLQDA